MQDMQARLHRGIPWIVATLLLLAAALVGIVADDFGRSVMGGPMAVMAALAGLALLLLVLQWWPQIFIVLLPCCLILPTKRGFFPFELAVFAFAAYAALDSLRSGDARLRGPRAIHAGFLAYIVSCALSIFVIRETGHFLGALKILVVAYLGLAVVFRYAGPREWTWFALSVPATGIAISLQLVRNYFSRGFHIRNVFLLRSFYSDLGWGSTNYVGAVLAVAILGTFILLILDRRTWLRAVCAGSLALMGVAMALLISRGTIVAVGLGILLLLMVLRGRQRWLLIGVAGAGAIAMGRMTLFKVIVARFTTASQAFSYVDRVRLWRDALERFVAHPWLGVGAGQGTVQEDTLQKLNPHNYFLSVASDTGVVGLIGWLCLLGALFAHCNTLLAEGGGRRPVARAVQVFLVVAILHSCYEPTFPGTHYMFLFFWVLAILYRCGEAQVGSGPLTSRS